MISGVLKGDTEGEEGRSTMALSKLSVDNFLRVEFNSGCESAAERVCFCLHVSLCLCSQRKGPGSGQEESALS